MMHKTCVGYFGYSACVGVVAEPSGFVPKVRLGSKVDLKGYFSGLFSPISGSK